MLTPRQAYQFDLQGFLHLKGVFPIEFCAALSRHLEALEGKAKTELPDGVFPSSTPVVNEYRVYNVVGCGEEFEKLIDHPVIMPFVDEMVPRPYRLCEAYSISRGPGIGIPLHSHWQADYDGGCPAPVTKYLKASISLTRTEPDDGPMVVIAGSHRSKRAFPYSPMHPDWVMPKWDRDFQERFMRRIPEELESVRWEEIPGYQEICADVGDLVLFTEDLWHGAAQKHTPARRQSVHLSYSPYQFPNWHGFDYGADLLARVSPPRRKLLDGPFLGSRHAASPHPELSLIDEFLFMPDSDRPGSNGST